MTSHLSDERLGDFVDERLSLDDRANVAKHVLVCNDCRGRLDELRGLVSAARSLGSIPAPVAAWEQLSERLEGTQKPVVRWRWWGSVAAACTIVVIAASVFSPRRESPADTSVASWKRVESLYEADVSRLASQAARSDSLLPRAVRESVEASMATVDDAIREARAALVQDPTSVALADRLVTNYRHKVELLRRISIMGGA